VLTPGARLGAYEIAGKLGEGGMGEVWRATDTRLGRQVALKVLPAGLADDPERHARFEREAKVLASLNHANIATLYGLEHLQPIGGPGAELASALPRTGEGAGKLPPSTIGHENAFSGHGPRTAGHDVERAGGALHVLVMELVEGEDLSERLGRGAVAVDEALGIAVQVAEALEAAHEKGIVHRDLKPANVKVTPDGVVKVLDFGLAKALDPLAGGASSDPAHSPTLLHSPAITVASRHGLLLGTAGYMAPEQARGRTVDKRADIWAFGVVLWEMLTGRRLFDGATTSDVLAAVLRDEPDLAALPAALPSVVRHVVARCLEKDPRRRFRDIGDVRLELEMAERSPAAAAGGPSAAARRPGAGALLGAAAVVLLALAGGVLAGRMLTRPNPAPAPVLRMTLAPPAEIKDVWNPALAADGTLLVYQGFREGKGRIFLQRLDEFAPQPLAGTEGAAEPFVSPDGRWVGFKAGARLLKISATGGDALALTEATANGPGACWNGDGTIVYSSSWLGGLRQVGADGTGDRELTRPDAAKGEKGHWWPQPVPGSRAVLFTAWLAKAGLNDAQIAVLDVKTGAYRSLLPGAHAFFVRPSHLVFYRAGAYHAVEFDPDTLAVRGNPVRVLGDCRALDPAGSSQVSFAVSPDGTLAYHPGLLVPEAAVVRVDADGTQHLLPFTARSLITLRLAPDGGRAVVVAQANGGSALWLLDLERGTEEQLQIEGPAWAPAWHPDGKRLAFLSMRRGDFDVCMKDLAGGDEPLLASDADEAPTGFSPDGSRLVFQGSDAEGRYALWSADLAAGGRRERLADLAGADNGRVSPDGRWLAFDAPQQGRREIYVQPFAGRGAPVRVSRSGGNRPAWSPSGQTLYYARRDDIVAVGYREVKGSFVAEPERVAAHIASPGGGGLAGFDVLPDGRSFVALRVVTPDEPPRLRVVLSWQTEIARALAAAGVGGT
jgi:serine/threonine-protein kinase